MSAILMFVLGCVIGWLYAVASEDAKQQSRANALRGLPPRAPRGKR